MKGDTMDFQEKVRVRIEHWIRHNEDHLQEYEELAGELDQAGENESAKHITNMVALVEESNQYLRRALETLT